MKYSVGDRIGFESKLGEGNHRWLYGEGTVAAVIGRDLEINWDCGFGPNGWDNRDHWGVAELELQGKISILNLVADEWEGNLELL